jgi:plasmid stabilization system protein ParE
VIVVVHEAAQAEIDEAIGYYRSISDVLGDAFRDETQRAISGIVERPNAWKPLARSLRRYRLNRFPYGIVYRVHNDRIEIYALMHLKRKPGYWRDRLKGPGP